MKPEPTYDESRCVMVSAVGSEDVHLALVGGGAAPEATLCGRPLVPAPLTRHFQEAGCCACAKVSLERGIDCAEETAQVMVNLRRFYEWASRAGKLTEGATPAAPALPA